MCEHYNELKKRSEQTNEKVVPIKIELECCEGMDENEQCLKRLCPIYRIAESSVDRNWPRLPTGFGNAYGNPKHGNYLAEVKDLLDRKQKGRPISKDLNPI